MPNGAAIFETIGAWEDFSTPSRDLRLLIAIDVVRGFPDRVARRPERYAMPSGKSVERGEGRACERARVRASATASSAIRAPTARNGRCRSRTSFERAHDLEMAYNPNDCVELRWGATPRKRRSRDLQTAPRRRARRC